MRTVPVSAYEYDGKPAIRTVAAKIATANFITRDRANINHLQSSDGVWICVIRAVSIFMPDQNTACAIQHKRFRLARLHPT
jgi:hypothetical protein